MSPATHSSFSSRLQQFWRHVTEGLELNQLWKQFQADARASYRLYSREVDFTKPQGQPVASHSWNLVKQFFWAILDQLSPARRVLLLLALVLLIFPDNFRFVGVLLLLLLLLLEVGDRVVMKRDLQISREIETWLVPSVPPLIPGVEMAFAARPANTVAGDYYDAFLRSSAQPGEERFLLVVADVAGKSIPAALLMAGFQASLKTLAATPMTLSELVDGLNRHAWSNSQQGRRFITAFVAELAPSIRTLTYINAGHNAPLLRRSTGAIERLEAGGLPLGVQPDASYQSGTVTLQPGDWLAIFTDGLVEAANMANEEYGEQRVIYILNAGCTDRPVNVISRLMVDLDVFVGDNLPLADDVTCMLVKVSS